ncbi:MAG TPA: DUF4129 domain-containing protein [Acidobacteriota bacterium]|nr:DUF4129 domain-containing protein [Acidobacteriota bacterium]HND21310.1 DUF4129 domain-containing protein [Acidobacteriota bacterium]HNG94343.1 DUF4129 domain-containing protein [Acidobacteriota bacterium]
MPFLARFLKIILCLVGVCWLSLTTALAGTSQEDYLRRFDEAHQLIGQALNLGQQPESPGQWRASNHLKMDDIVQFRLLLPRNEVVDFQGQSITVDNSRLYDLLEKQQSAQTPADSEQALALLNEEMAELRTRMFEPDNSASAGRGQVTEKMQEILSRRDFSVKQGDTWRDRFQRWLGEFLLDLLRMLWPSFKTGGMTMLDLAKMVVIALVVVAVAWITRVLILRFWKRDPAEKKGGKRVILGEEIDESTTAEELLTAGMDLARTGEYRQAIRKVYVALLYDMDERQVIHIEPGLTNREYLNRVRSQVRIYSPMHEMTNRFDEFWYGQFVATKEDFQKFLLKYREAVGGLPTKAKA